MFLPPPPCLWPTGDMRVPPSCCRHALLLSFPSAPQAKKVQELVVSIIRQFTEAYGPLILVLGEGMFQGACTGSGGVCVQERDGCLTCKAPVMCRCSGKALKSTTWLGHSQLPRSNPPSPCTPPQRTCTILMPPASACCPAPSTTSRCAAPCCSSSPTGAPGPAGRLVGLRLPGCNMASGC